MYAHILTILWSKSSRFTNILIGIQIYQRMKVKVLVVQSCPTLCDPMDCSPPGSSVGGILQARILQWVAMPFSRVSSLPRDGTWVSWIVGRFFIIWATREAYKYIKVIYKLIVNVVLHIKINFCCNTLLNTMFQFSLVAQSCPTLCDPMNRSTPGLPVHHQLPEFTQLMSIESVMPSSHRILCRPLLLLPPNPSQHQGLFRSINSSHDVAKVLEFQLQHQSFQWTPRTDIL